MFESDIHTFVLVCLATSDFVQGVGLETSLPHRPTLKHDPKGQSFTNGEHDFTKRGKETSNPSL